MFIVSVTFEMNQVDCRKRLPIKLSQEWQLHNQTEIHSLRYANRSSKRWARWRERVRNCINQLIMWQMHMRCYIWCLVSTHLFNWFAYADFHQPKHKQWGSSRFFFVCIKTTDHSIENQIKFVLQQRITQTLEKWNSWCEKLFFFFLFVCEKNCSVDTSLDSVHLWIRINILFLWFRLFACLP